MVRCCFFAWPTHLKYITLRFYPRCYTLCTIDGFIVYYPPPSRTTVFQSHYLSVNNRHHPRGVVTSVITLPSLARAARALMALSKLSADDEHGIILGQRVAPRRVLQLFRLFRS